MSKLIRTFLILAVLAAIGWAGKAYFASGRDAGGSFRTVTIARGPIVSSISATGTLEPEEVIDVGAQVAGQINEFGKDDEGKTIDRRSIVHEGMVLARIDDSLYAADAASSAAQLKQAAAGVEHAEADLKQMQATLNKAQRDWERAQKAGIGNGVLSQEAYDQYLATYEIARANLLVGKAAIEQAKGTMGQAQASVARAQRNLGYCVIKSPVNGEIIDRRVNIGQTVVSSLNAPSLFLIAKDLKRMEVWASVNEADIGKIQNGQPVTFNVDAFPGRTFTGTVNKVWLNASMTQNVVTYTVEIATDNSDGKLFPYMTANVQFEVEKRDDVLLVPNAALRFTPQEQNIAPDARGAMAGDTPRGARGPGGAGDGAASPSSQPATRPARMRGDGARGGNLAANRERGMLWVKDGQFLTPVRVRVGISDGMNTEVEAKEIAEGTEIVISDSTGDAGPGAGGRSPFLPQFGNRRRGGGG